MSEETESALRIGAAAGAYLMLFWAPIDWLMGRADSIILIVSIGAAFFALYLVFRVRLIAALQRGRVPATINTSPALRGIVLGGLAALGLGAYFIAEGQFRDAAVALVAGVAAGGAWYLLRQQSLGWIVDSNGEIQKVIGRDRHGPVFNPTSHAQRRLEAQDANKRRRKVLVLSSVGFAICASLTYFFWKDDNGLALMTGYFTPVAGGWLLFVGVQEAAYRLGYQNMKGAMVFDPVPIRPGVDRAKEQKAHGDARPATEAEVIAASTGEGNRSSVHDMQF